MWQVWMKDAIDEDRFIVAGITCSQADAIVDNIKAIMPDAVVWMEEE